VHGLAGEEEESDHLGLDGVVIGETGQRLIERQDILGRFLDGWSSPSIQGDK
jgi:hypothetical protein